MNVAVLAARPAPALPVVRWRRWLWVVGPGLAVMLADTDAGSVITAAQSGAQWGYRLLALQAILVPILFLVQELTVRLGAVTGRGHGELIRERFGPFWAWLSVGTLVVASVGALVTEMSGIAGVGALFGVPQPVTVALVIAGLLAVVWTGSYRSVERTALAIGAFELAFLAVAWQARPDGATLVGDLARVPIGNPSYLYLAAANVGAVVMPWMIFYQQSAVVDKGLRPEHLTAARWDTAIGAVLTQVIMAAILVAAAATIGQTQPGAALTTIPQIANALTAVVGSTAGTLLFACGVSGAALLAAIVVSLTVAWGLGEVTGYKRSLEHRPREAPWFYAAYTAALVLSGVLVGTGADPIQLSVAVEVMNALLLPIVLGFLFLLAWKALPEPHRLRGWYAALVACVVAATAGFGVFAGVSGLLA